MAEVRFHIWPLTPSVTALSDLGRDQVSNYWLTTIVQSAASPGIFDGLVGSLQSHPVALALTAMGLLIVLAVLVQSLAILAFGLDRLLGRLSSQSEKKGGTTEGWMIRRWLRSLWSKPDD